MIVHSLLELVPVNSKNAYLRRIQLYIETNKISIGTVNWQYEYFGYWENDINNVWSNNVSHIYHPSAPYCPRPCIYYPGPCMMIPGLVCNPLHIQVHIVLRSYVYYALVRPCWQSFITALHTVLRKCMQGRPET
jgi:hypothetical protein